MPRVSSGQGKVREIPYQAKVRELSGNFVMGQGKLKMLWKVSEKSGNFERVMAMVVSWVIWNILDNSWMSSSYDSLDISLMSANLSKLCPNSYGTRVNQYCESNVTRGQGKQKMAREKSGKSQEVLWGAIAGHPDATWRILWRHGCALHYTCWAPHEWRTYVVSIAVHMGIQPVNVGLRFTG